MADHEYTSLKVLLQGSSTEGQLASVPEESTTGFTDALPPSDSYRDSIRRVSVVCSDWRIRSRQSGSTDSAASRSTNSSYSSNSASIGTATSELRKIAQRMASDGYTQRMVQAFHTVSLTHTFGQDRALRKWFIELDVDWVLDVLLKLLLEEASVYSLKELVRRWIRALTVIVASVTTISDAPAAAQFVTASVSAMLVFVDAMVQVNGEEKLQAMLQMYICVCSASYGILPHTISSGAQSILNDINSSMDRQGNKLIESICDTMVQVRRTLMKDDNLCATEILEGGGEVHKNTKLMVDYIVLMSKAHASTQMNSGQSHNTGKLGGLIHYTIDYLNNLLVRKSELCSDPSLRYLFLLNNSYFIVQMVSKTSVSLNLEQLCGHQTELKLTPECEKYMDSYLDVSWRNVLSFIPKSNFHGPLRRWIHTTSLAKFQSAFDNTYQAQKFWKVPEPRLRSLLRETIIKRVISAYNDYLKEHPELEKHVSGGSSSPKILEEMLGELFEG
ncbi:exocyst complex component EXO70B2-like [Triticum dicoccoides]|uniref:exocyst complex component EXO70B2-like n=1 Tax=Triticum dicoccoides TaxID=85692 RepID=UPI00188E4700|nr:exocyst complex component EXO70B2-like [Triticum dicoccoides]